MASSAHHHPGGNAGSSKHNDLSRRVRLACNYCRSRKTRCDGQMPCRTCSILTKPPVQCIYADSGKRVMVAQSHLNWLKARVKALEAKLPEGVPAEGSEDSASDATSIDINPLADGIADFSMTASGQRQYLGRSSSTSLGIRFRDFVRTRVENLSGDFEYESPSYRVELPSRRLSISSLPDLPPLDVAKRLFAAQYAYLGTIFAFLEPTIFEQRVTALYSGDIGLMDREECLICCQVLVIFAYGQMYSINQWMSRDGPPGFSYFLQALEILPEIHEEGSVLFVEVLALIGYFMQILNRRDAAFSYTGLALRMAINLGLHEEVNDPSMDAIEKEYRRRLWWSVYSMDHILCAKSGNPISIADEDISVLPPSSLPSEPPISSATILKHYTALSRILGKIAKSIYRKSPKTSTSLIAAVQGIMKELAAWSRELPEPLHFDFTKLDEDIQRHKVSMFLHYYQCVNMTARPLLFNIVQKRLSGEQQGSDWTADLSPTTVKVIESCIGAAKDTATIMRKAARQNLVATYGFMDCEHIFSAAMVLVMINIAFPPSSQNTQAMESAIEVIKMMAERGNESMRARYQFIEDLCSMIPGRPRRPSDASAALPVRSASTSLSSGQVPTGSSSNVGAGGSGITELDIGSSMGPSPITNFPVLDTTADLGEILSSEITAGDQILWEEGYGNLDMSLGMEFDWSQWSESMRPMDGSGMS